MLDIFSEEPQLKKKTTPISEEVGKGLLRGGINLLEWGGMLGMSVMPSYEKENTYASAPQDELYLPTRKEDLYDFIQIELEPLKKKLTPDPGSSSAAGKFFGAISELPLQLLAGPTGIAGTAATQTGKELANSGVDAKTATMLGAGAGVTTAALIGIPAAGKTLGKTLGLISVNPVTGTLQRAGTKAVLEESGYEKQAEMFDPFDPASIGIDLALGAFGGVLGHKQAKKNALKKSLHTEVVDAIDVIANQQKVRKATPFEPSIKSNTANQQAMEKALSDISEGKAVDVSGVLKESPNLELRKKPFPEEIYTKKVTEKAVAELNETLKPFEDAGIKEPWQMTKQEFADVVTPKTTELDLLRRYVEETGEKINTEADFQKVIDRFPDEYKKIKQIEATKESIYKSIPKNIREKFGKNQLDTWTHENFVGEAVKKGQPISPEVLKDYPELQKITQPQRWKAEEISKYPELTNFKSQVIDQPIDISTKRPVYAVKGVDKILDVITQSQKDIPVEEQGYVYRAIFKEADYGWHPTELSPNPKGAHGEQIWWTTSLDDAIDIADSKSGHDLSKVDIVRVPKDVIASDGTALIQNLSHAGNAETLWVGTKGIPKQFIDKINLTDVTKSEIIKAGGVNDVKTGSSFRQEQQRNISWRKVEPQKTLYPETGRGVFAGDIEKRSISKSDTTGTGTGEGRLSDTFDVGQGNKSEQLETFLNDPIEARVESFLQDKDIPIITGTDAEGKSIYTSAREVIDEARLELKQIQDMQPLYMLAANCLRLGGE